MHALAASVSQGPVEGPVESPVEGSVEHEALLSFLYQAPVGLIHCAMDGSVAMLNPISAQLLMPLARDGGLENLYEALQDVLPDLRQRVAAYVGRHGRICDAVRFALPPQRPGDTCRGQRQHCPATLALTLLKLDDARLMAVLDDVTEQVRRERLLQQSSAWFGAILTDIEDYALVALDRQGRVRSWTESVGRVTGLAADDVQGQPFSVFDVPSGADAASARAQDLERLRRADRDGWSVDDGWRRRVGSASGAFWGTSLIAPTDGSPDVDTCYHLILRDVNDRREAAQGLLRSINCDFLTGLANRRAFVETAERDVKRALRDGTPLSLVLLDADHFKAVNDRHGHPAGDDVLKHLAVAIQAGFRDADLVARIGGEEFAVLLPATDTVAAGAVAQRVLAALAAAPLALQGFSVQQTLSAGVAQLGAGADTVDGLLARADAALYAAKTAGRNRVCKWDELPA